MKKTLFSAALLLASALPLSAQRTAEFNTPTYPTADAIRMFQHQDYVGCKEIILTYFGQQPESYHPTDELLYHLAASAFFLEDGDAEQLLHHYLDHFPWGDYRHSAWLMMGIHNIELRRYDHALHYLEQVDVDMLPAEEHDRWCFYLAYCEMKEGRFGEAAHHFSLLKVYSSSYAVKGYYYSAYVAYRQGRYHEAMADLEQVVENPEFREPSLYYITQMEFVQGDYKAALDHGLQLLEEFPDDEKATEIRRIAGNCHYHMGDMQGAISELISLLRTSLNATTSTSSAYLTITSRSMGGRPRCCAA